jgi:hypothetical protein
MKNEGYNGWTNRATWLVAIHFNPETRGDVETAKQWLEEEAEKLNSFFSDLVDLNEINWRELEETVQDDEEETDEEETDEAE